MPDSTSKIDSLALRPRTLSSGEVGRILGNRYRLVAQIGAGASAQVFLADDLSLGRRVAVKCLRSGLSDDARFVKRFRAEATAAAQLSHPNLLAVYDWDESPSSAYIVTEVLLGGSLLDLIDRQPLTPSQGLLVALQVAQGLKYAHSIGWVHRDIKPANLLFGQEGRLRIADFGIARAVAEAAWTEPEGVLVGTARYAAPEQAEGDAIDGKADIYSLALTIVEAVTGRVPLLGENALSTMVLRQDRDVDGFEELGPLGTALARAGRADPRARPTAAQLIENLTRTARSLPRPQRLALSSGPARFTHPTGEPEGAIDLRDKPDVAHGGRHRDDSDDRSGGQVEGRAGAQPTIGHRSTVESDHEVAGHELRPGDRIKSRPIRRPSDDRVAQARATPRPRFAGHSPSRRLEADATEATDTPDIASHDDRVDGVDEIAINVAETAIEPEAPADTPTEVAAPAEADVAAEPGVPVDASGEVPVQVVEGGAVPGIVIGDTPDVGEPVEPDDDVDVDVDDDVDIDEDPSSDARILELPDSAPFNPWQRRPARVDPGDHEARVKPQAPEPRATPPTTSWLEQSKLDPPESSDADVDPGAESETGPKVEAPTISASGPAPSLAELTDVAADDSSPSPSQEEQPTTELRVEPSESGQEPDSGVTPTAGPASLSGTTFFVNRSIAPQTGGSSTPGPRDASSPDSPPPRKPLPITTPPVAKSWSAPETPESPTTSATSGPAPSEEGTIPSIFGAARRKPHVAKPNESCEPTPATSSRGVPPETAANMRAEVNHLRSRRRGRHQEPPRPVRVTRLFDDGAGAVQPAATEPVADAGKSARAASAPPAATPVSAPPAAAIPSAAPSAGPPTAVPPLTESASAKGVSVVRLDAGPTPERAPVAGPALGGPLEPASQPQTDDGDRPSRLLADEAAHPGQATVTSTHEPTSRRPQWLAMAVLICLILVMIGAVAAIAVRSESGTVAGSTGSTVLTSSALAGDYVGGTSATAEADAERYNWLLSVTEERRTGTEAGEVIEQEPQAGASLGDGDRLNIVVSLGPELRAVPEIAGQTVDEATVILERADLEVGDVTEIEGDEEEGVVLGLEVDGDEPESRLEAGTAVDLIVSAGPSASSMPSFVGLTVNQAIAQANNLGLELRQEQDFSERYDEGFVVHTEPPTDTPVEPGDSVTIVVSRGAPFVTIPDVAGMLPDEAAAELSAAGFEVGATTGPSDLPVVATDPAGGEGHRKGSAVTLITEP